MRLAITNAAKGAIIGVVNTALALVVSFGVDVTDEQQAAIVGLVNAVLILWVALTYRDSPHWPTPENPGPDKAP